MKIVEWIDEWPLIVTGNGDDIIIEDSAFGYDLEVGDLIHHISVGFGTGCYLVTRVDSSASPRLVTIKGAI